MALNSFGVSMRKGHLINTTQARIMNARVDNSAADFVAGAAVKLADYNGATGVTPITALTDAVYGFVPYTAKKTTFAAGQDVLVCTDEGVMIMEASAAIAVGAELQISPTTMKVATQTASNTIIGVALEAAAADGDLIRVEIK